MAFYLKKFKIQNFRSISAPVTLQFTKGELTILCGPNNNGKTNCLRAMDLFFHMDPERFQAEKDRPYHGTHGSRSGKSQATFTGTFEDDKGKVHTIKQVYKGKPATLTISLDNSEKKEDKEKARDIINQFQFIFVEANNVNLPELIREMFTEKILALGMKKNKGQTKAWERLQNFQEDCQKVVKKINNHLTKQFHSFFTDSSLKKEVSGYKFNITFPHSLIGMMASFINTTLQDQNDLDLESKGSGYQRLALFSMISYYATLIKDKKVIWGIDEPEGSLQSKLQKCTFQNLKKLAQNHCIIITTHSSFFIDIYHLDTTFLLESKSDPKKYRKKDKVHQKTTFISPRAEKLKLIKEYIGIDAVDTWELFSTNILVEGKTDRNYLQALAEALQLSLPCTNIIPVDGAQKMLGHLWFYNNSHRADDDQAKDNTESSKKPKPQITCLLDRDQEGRDVYNKIKPHSYENIEVSTEYVCDADDKLKDKFRRTIEDLVYPEVILHATNQFLTLKKNFNKIPEDCLEKRSTKAYQEKTFLEFLAEQARHADSHCNLNFNTDKIKKEICKGAIQYIKKHPKEIAKLDQNRPQVKAFLKNLFTFPKNSEEGPKPAQTGESDKRNDKNHQKPVENRQLPFPS